jgi:hypothetical protein
MEALLLGEGFLVESGAAVLRPQIVTSILQDIDFIDKKDNWSQFVTSFPDDKYT